jgi:hypothetical protein
VRLDARIGEGDRLRLRVARQQRLRHRQAADGHAAARAGTRAGRCAVAVLVVEIEDRWSICACVSIGGDAASASGDSTLK